MRSWGEVVKDTGKGAVRGGIWGALIGAGAILAAPLTGCASLGVLVAALPAAGGAALVGAKVGGVSGALFGMAGQCDKIDAVATGVVAVGLGGNVLGDGSRSARA